MAQNGSRSPQTCSSSLPFSSASPPPRPPGPGPRVHRPRLAIMTPPPPTTITLQPLAMSSRRPIVIQQPLQASAEVTLTAPRPDNDRTVNEYVETPFRPPDVHFASKSKHVKSSDLVRGLESRLSSSSTSSVDRTRNLVRRDPHHQTLHLPIGQHPNKSRAQRGGGVVTKQPGATATFKKDLPGSSTGAGGRGEGASGTNADCFRGSIICPECGRCRCDSCRQPRPLPSRWLCNDACFCSAETGLDYASCLCCVKGLFYHCSKDYELDRDGDGSCADDPCSCASHRIYTRWGCLSLLALALPCLLCYWPLKGCVALCENCYSRYANQGCRCEPRDPKITDLTPEKRLLDTSPDF